MNNRLHKAVLGTIAGMCFAVVSQLTIAGAVTCPSGKGNADWHATECNQVNRYHHDSLGDYGVLALLTSFDHDNDRAPAWGYAMRKVRALHSYLFEGFLMDFGKPKLHDAVDKPRDKGHDYPNGKDPKPPMATISEPGTIALLSLGLFALGVIHLRKRTRHV